MIRKNNPSLLSRIFFNQKFLSLIILSGLILLSFPLIKNIKQRHGADQEIDELREEINRVEGKNKDLQKVIGYLGSEQFVEEQARINFGLKKDGEQVVVVQSGNDKISDSNGIIFNIPGLDNAEPEKQETNPQKWFKYFFEN